MIRKHVIGAALGALTLAVLACTSPPPSETETPTPATGESTGVGPAINTSGGEEEPTPAAGTLEIQISAPGTEHCQGEDIHIEITVLNFEALRSALAAAMQEGEEARMLWGVALSDGERGSPEETGLKDSHSVTVHPGGVEGAVTVRVTVEVVIDGPDGRRTFASDEETVMVTVQRCQYSVALNFEGTFQDTAWTREETATMEPVYLEALPDGEYRGEGTLSAELSQNMTTDEGECHNTAPWTGTTDVSITGRIEDGQLVLEFSFEPGEASGGVMTCSAAGYAVSTEAMGGPIDGGFWGLGQQEFPLEGGTETVSVEQGLSGAPGSGQVVITVERVE